MHRSANLFITAVSSHSHIIGNQPQRTFFNIAVLYHDKKSLSRKIHELKALIGSSNDSQPQVPNKCIVKIDCCRITTGGCFSSFSMFCIHRFCFFRMYYRTSHFFSLKIKLERKFKVRKKNRGSYFGLHPVLKYVQIQVTFPHKLLK